MEERIGCSMIRPMQKDLCSTPPVSLHITQDHIVLRCFPPPMVLRCTMHIQRVPTCSEVGPSLLPQCRDLQQQQEGTEKHFQV